MKRTSKVLALVLAAALLLACLAGCAEKEKENVIKIGFIGPLTGDAAQYGVSGRNAAQIAVDEINANGGINGFKIEFNAQDDECDPEKAVNAYNTLKDWGMQILLGPVTSGSAIAVSAEAANDRIFLLTGSASSTDVTDGKDNAFQLCFTDPNQGIRSAEYIAENMSTDYKISVIYKNDDAYSQGIRDAFVKRAEELGLNVVNEGTFTDGADTDFTSHLIAAQAAGADFIYLPIYYQPAALILAQANQMDYHPYFLGGDGMDGILGQEGFNTSLAEGVMLMTPFNAQATDEMTVNFVKSYQEKHQETPDQFAADFYDCVYSMKQALENIKYDGSLDNAKLCDALIAQYTSMEYTGVTGENMTWTTKGEVSKVPMAVVIKDGIYEKLQ